MFPTQTRTPPALDVTRDYPKSLNTTDDIHIETHNNFGFTYTANSY